MPNIIRVPEPYAANNIYSRVKEAAQWVGEECIGLIMYRVGVDDRGPDPRPRCACFNEVYADTQQFDCPYCYGTTFAGGVKEAWRIWTIWDDDENPVERSRFGGIWNPHEYSVQTEPWPTFYETDYLLRVRRWDTNKQAPLELGDFHRITDTAQYSVRTGNRFGESDTEQVAQKLKAVTIPKTEPIYQYDVIENITFPRRDQQPR